MAIASIDKLPTSLLKQLHRSRAPQRCSPRDGRDVVSHCFVALLNIGATFAVGVGRRCVTEMAGHGRAPETHFSDFNGSQQPRDVKRASVYIPREILDFLLTDT